MKKIRNYFLIFFIIASIPLTGYTQDRSIGFFVGDTDAYTCLKAVEQLKIPGLEIRVFTEEHIGRQEMQAFITRMDIGVVDIMHRNLPDWLLTNKGHIHPNAKLYAVRTSSHTKDFLDAGFMMDEEVRSYFAYTSADNLSNLVRFLAHREFDVDVSFTPPIIPPENGLYHPDADRLFDDMVAYFTWYQQAHRYQEGELWSLFIIFPTFPVDAKKEPVDALIRAYEQRGMNTVTVMRSSETWIQALDRLISQAPLKDNLGSITSFTFKFSSNLSPDLLTMLKKADVPIFNPQWLFFTSKEQWLSSPEGLSPPEIPYQFSTPELSGLIEPTVMGVKEKMRHEEAQITSSYYVPVKRQIEKLAGRAAKWHALKRLPNKDKTIVLVYYNHGAGKQNIGASYLNVFRSIQHIIARLKSEGYTIQGEFSEKKIMDLLIKTGRNIGSWAPDELDKLMQAGDLVTVDLNDYKTWLAEVDQDFLAHVEKDWGSPEESDIMINDGKFIIPCVKLGNLTLVPQPVRGWSDDPEKLYHSTILYPHHQYVAFYLWLQHVLQPDAMISLGTHGTHEWLPGKQAGLTQSCPPEVLIGDIPSLYPYIVDDVGEGIQAKRRGRAAIIDHATPPFRQGGIYEEYSKLATLISEYETAGSERIQETKLERIQKMVLQLGLDQDLGLEDVTEDALEEIEHYLLALKTEMIPYGLHTFGVSPSGEGLEETAAAIASKSAESPEFYKKQLTLCGPEELNSLVKGLNAQYIPPGSGNDPIRNPESLPTGKNFYAFDPDKVPSKEAWEQGKKAAQQIIEQYRQADDGRYPQQLGVILWSVEVIRDEGINVATALYLLGIQPIWDKRDKIKDVIPIPGNELGRPRIDVLLQMSGLFRDTFPSVALLLDKAVKKAAVLDDVENFIKQHTEHLEQALLSKGYSSEDAKKLATVRIFSAQPGAYGTKVDDMVGASGLWEEDSTVAENAFINMVSYGYSKDIWGENVKDAYRENLKKVDATVHSISSNLYSTMDNDDMFQYLGGLSMAVRHESGKDPDVFISLQKTLGEGHVESLATTIGRELRSRYLNPTWIEGMQKENYAGAREMAEFVENMWGWQVTTPKAIDKTKWEQTYEVYVEDKYGLDLKEFFNQENPWAYQSVTARMLEAIRKNYWQASEEVQKKLAIEYAMNVVEKGVACCDHTCNNPLLNQMVVNIVSLPGVMSPEIVEQFKLAIEKAMEKSLEQAVPEREQLLRQLTEGFERPPSKKPEETASVKQQESESASATGKASEIVQGYEMEDVQRDDDSTAVSSSGVQWFAAFFVLLIILLIIYGVRRERRIR